MKASCNAASSESYPTCFRGVSHEKATPVRSFEVFLMSEAPLYGPSEMKTSCNAASSESYPT